MASEQRQTVHITPSVPVLSLVTATLTSGTCIVFEPDRFNNSSQVFTPQATDLDLLIHDGLNAYAMGRYDVAEAKFREALNLFSNY